MKVMHEKTEFESFKDRKKGTIPTLHCTFMSYFSVVAQFRFKLVCIISGHGLTKSKDRKCLQMGSAVGNFRMGDIHNYGGIRNPHIDDNQNLRPQSSDTKRRYLMPVVSNGIFKCFECKLLSSCLQNCHRPLTPFLYLTHTNAQRLYQLRPYQDRKG